LKSIVKQTLAKEVETTKNWQIISKSAGTGNNVAVTELCQWFMKEQMEEESSMTTLYQKVMNIPLSGGLETIDMLLRDNDPISK
jgi:ferritin